MKFGKWAWAFVVYSNSIHIHCHVCLFGLSHDHFACCNRVLTMSSEREKMLAGDRYRCDDPELVEGKGKKCAIDTSFDIIFRYWHWKLGGIPRNCPLLRSGS